MLYRGAVSGGLPTSRREAKKKKNKQTV